MTTHHPLLPCCVAAVDWLASTVQYQDKDTVASTYLPLHHHHLEIMLLPLTVNRLHTLLLSNQLTSPHPLHAPLGLPHKTHTSQQHFVHYKHALEIHCCTSPWCFFLVKLETSSVSESAVSTKLK